MVKKFTLQHKERLKSRKAIEQLFGRGQGFTVLPFRVLYQVIPSGNLQVGVAVSSRNFKKAVDRNRIKRLTREAWRLQKQPLGEKLKEREKGLVVFFTYTGKVLPDYRTVHDKVGRSVKKLLKIADESNIANT